MPPECVRMPCGAQAGFPPCVDTPRRRKRLRRASRGLPWRVRSGGCCAPVCPPPACGVSQCGGNMFRQNCGRKPLQDKDLPDRAVPAVTIPVTISQVVAPCLCPAYFLLMCCLGYDTCRQYHTGRECGPVSGRWSGACFRYSAGDSIRTPAQRPA